MNIIKSIEVRNVKGIDYRKINLRDLHANKVNIFVAPNGFGKSTIAAAFKGAAHGKLKLKASEYYKDTRQRPELSISVQCESFDGTFVSSEELGEISNKFNIFVINNSLYAKSKRRYINENYSATMSELAINDIEIYKSIPDKVTINYTEDDLRNFFKEKKKFFLNIKFIFDNYENLVQLNENKNIIKNCMTQKSVNKKIEDFINNLIEDTSVIVRDSIQEEQIQDFCDNSNIKFLYDIIKNLKNKPKNWKDCDNIFALIQLCYILKINENFKKLEKATKYLYYKKIKERVNTLIKEINTTGRPIKAKEIKNKLIVSFDSAETISNGERDVLILLINLMKFEIDFTKEHGILIIDEVFDYLDGSNLLVVEYFLTKTIDRLKKDKILFPIIFTHLDPEVFNNFTFSKKRKIHYLESYSELHSCDEVVELLKLRNSAGENKDILEKYFLHYHNEEKTHSFSNDSDFTTVLTNTKFYEDCLNEIKFNYLHSNRYNPIYVCIALRIKIEEEIYNMLPRDKQEEFINIHKTANKLEYASKFLIDVPELFYLLSPLYNDIVHLSDKDNINQDKLKSCYLKTQNKMIKQLIKQVFEYK